MGLLQKAIETYDANTHLVGVYRDGHEPLAPIGHTLTNAGIEITLNKDGLFLSARKVGKDEPKILIPVTEESGGRTSSPAAHPLCDKPDYIFPVDAEKYEKYLEALRSWAESDFSHPFLRPILCYVESKTIRDDLSKAGISEKCTASQDSSVICWRINGFDNEDPACWRNQNLFTSFINYYTHSRSEKLNGLCMVSGKNDSIMQNHPSGIVAKHGKAKLISTSEKLTESDPNFVYSGRFTRKYQAATVSYQASQKAHNALRWLVSEQGVFWSLARTDGRLCKTKHRSVFLYASREIPGSNYQPCRRKCLAASGSVSGCR